ncbi:MAG: hypothetical protein QOH14_1066, partial [Pseudonocardiales bacterium]|nr:hypothetical protein [Pseudonocardiales bacterium]
QMLPDGFGCLPLRRTGVGNRMIKYPTATLQGPMSTVIESVDVNVPVTTAYNQWTQFEAFPQFMSACGPIGSVAACGPIGFVSRVRR